MRYGLIFILLSLFFFSCSKGKRYVGTYRLNISQSDLGHYASDSDKYQGLLLIMKPNHTFEFSKKTPFLIKQKGSWSIKTEYSLIAVVNHICLLDCGEGNRENVLEAGSNGNVYIIYPIPMKEKDYVNKLSFDRIK